MPPSETMDTINPPVTGRTRTVPWWVKALVLGHVFCITVWSCPSPRESLMTGKTHPPLLALGDDLRIFNERYLKSLAIVRLALFSSGTWQYWDMFAPNPADTDWYGDVVVHYKNGTQKVVPFPRMFSLSIPQKYIQERFRKFYERSHDEVRSPYFFEPFIYYEALENYADPRNPPVKIELRRHWKRNMPPGLPETKEYSQYAYFVGEIDPVELKRIAREKA